MADGYLLGEEAIRAIQRELQASRQRFSALERRLANQGVRRHQTMYLPPVAAVKFKNNASEAVPPFSVMRVTGATTDSKPLLTIDKPNTTFYRLYLVNGRKEVAAGKTGTGTWLSESAYVAYNSSLGTPAYGEVWGPKPSQWTLEKYYYGFEIQGGNTTIDEVGVVLAVQHRVDSVQVKTNGAHNRDASQAVHLYDTNDTDTTIDIADVLNRYVDLEDNVWADLLWQGNKAVLIAGDCNPPEE